MATLRARDHRVFAGKLEKEGLGLAERAIVAAVRAEEGDFRPWAEIDAWAAGIAAELRPGSRPGLTVGPARLLQPGAPA
jgi:menaquinone-dependent protoporphyrinogen oxidase